MISGTLEIVVKHPTTVLRGLLLQYTILAHHNKKQNAKHTSYCGKRGKLAYISPPKILFVFDLVINSMQYVMLKVNNE